VLIPQANVKHLMLRQDVVDAVAAGKFRVFPIQTIEQGIEVLTGVPAGVPDEDGQYPPESISGRIVARLDHLAERQREHERPDQDEDEEPEEEARPEKPPEDDTPTDPPQPQLRVGPQRASGSPQGQEGAGA
jgi:predicted ATP-dependent protease